MQREKGDSREGGRKKIGRGDFFYRGFSYFRGMQEKEKTIWQRGFRRYANKYTLVGAVFVVWLALFDKYSFLDQLELRGRISDLEKDRQYYRERVEENKRKKDELTGDRDKLEKFAREEYLMKRDNEDIFIID